MSELTSRRLGELLAHLAHFPREDAARVRTALGHHDDASITAAKEVVKAALDANDAAPARELSRGFEITLKRLATLQPAVSQVRQDPHLEPTRHRPTVLERPRLVPLPPSNLLSEAPSIAVAKPPPDPAVPTYLQEVAPPPTMASRKRVAITDAIDVGWLKAIGTELPFEAPPVSAPPREGVVPGLDTFAQLTVALASDEPREEVLARFGLTEVTRQSLAEHWGERITRDASLRQTFDDLVRKLRGQRRPQSERGSSS